MKKKILEKRMHKKLKENKISAIFFTESQFPPDSNTSDINVTMLLH